MREKGIDEITITVRIAKKKKASLWQNNFGQGATKRQMRRGDVRKRQEHIKMGTGGYDSL